MSEAKARELLTMAAKALRDLFNLKQDGRGHLIDWNLVAQKAEKIDAYLAAVPAPPAEPTLGEAHPFSYVGEDECGYCNLPREHPIHWRAAPAAEPVAQPTTNLGPSSSKLGVGEPVARIAITEEALRTNPSATLTTTTEPVAQQPPPPARYPHTHTIHGCMTYAAAPQPEAPTPADDLVARIERAIDRITSGGAPMRIPRDLTDADIVLADCRKRIESDAKRIRELEATLQQIADRGTHHDLTPTMFFNGDDKAMYAAMCEYLQGADANVRAIARRALATPDSAASPTGGEG